MQHPASPATWSVKPTAKKRSEAEKKHHQLTYRGVAYCKPCPPCEVKIAYY